MWGRPTKGAVSRGLGLPQYGVGTSNTSTLAGGLRLGSQGQLSFPCASSLAVEALKPLCLPHGPLSFPVRQVTLSAVCPAPLQVKAKGKEQVQTYRRVQWQ